MDKAGWRLLVLEDEERSDGGQYNDGNEDNGQAGARPRRDIQEVCSTKSHPPRSETRER